MSSTPMKCGAQTISEESTLKERELKTYRSSSTRKILSIELTEKNRLFQLEDGSWKIIDELIYLNFVIKFN